MSSTRRPASRSVEAPFEPARVTAGRGEHRTARPLLIPDQIFRLGTSQAPVLVASDPPISSTDRADPAVAGRADSSPMHAAALAQGMRLAVSRRPASTLLGMSGQKVVYRLFDSAHGAPRFEEAILRMGCPRGDFLPVGPTCRVDRRRAWMDDWDRGLKWL